MCSGGRASSRNASGYQYDHGMQFLRASTPEVTAIIDRWLSDGEHSLSHKPAHHPVP